MNCSTPGLPVHHQLPDFIQTPLLLLPPISHSIRVFYNESTLHMRWPKYWSFSFSISPSNEHPGLISFRTDWLNLFTVQGTLKRLLQHHTSKASIFWRSFFFTVQLSNPCMTTGKNKALTRKAFVGKVMSLLLNMLSRLVITFLPRSSASFNFMAAVTTCSDFGAQKNKVWHYFHCFPIYFPWSDGTRCQDLRFLNVEPTFSLFSFTFIKRLFSSSSLSAIRVGAICLSEVIDISPSNLDSSLYFFQPSVSHDVLCI